MKWVIKRVIKWTVMGGILGLIVFFAKQGSMVAASEAEVYADEVQVRPGESVKIPVRIRNNTGMMAYLLTAEYDPGKIEIVSISAGECSQNGIFDHNLSTQKKGNVDILWSYTKEVKKDGVLFYVQISAKKKLGKKKTKIRLSYSSEDTFNEKYESIDWKCTQIKIQGSEHTVVSTDEPPGHTGKETQGNPENPKNQEKSEQTNPAADSKQERGTSNADTPEKTQQAEDQGSMGNGTTVENSVGDGQKEEGRESGMEKGEAGSGKEDGGKGNSGEIASARTDTGEEDKRIGYESEESPDVISGQSINIEDRIRIRGDQEKEQEKGNEKSKDFSRNGYAKIRVFVPVTLIIIICGMIYLYHRKRKHRK